MKRRIDTILGKETTTFTLEVTKDQHSYKLPAEAEVTMIVGFCGLVLKPYSIGDDDYDYKAVDDHIHFSPSLMKELFNDGSEKEEIKINYNRLVEYRGEE
jgi:hypothetical protein